MMKSKAAIAIAFVVALGTATGTALAKDSVVVSVAEPSGSAVIVNNGQASGTIQLFYTVNAMQFPVGEFASFNLNWIVNLGSPTTNYGSGVIFKLVQDQQGGNVDFFPAPDKFTLTGAGQIGMSKVTILITPDKDGNLPPNADGTELVGNLKLNAGSKVGTVSNIQVHIVLVHPTNCLKIYNFVTGEDFGTLDATTLNVPTRGAKAGTVVSSQPGQFSDNVLIVNMCGMDQTFNLGINLDKRFSTNPSGNPGNAVFTYTAAGAFVSSSFTAMMAEDGIPHQQNVCLQNMTVPAGASFLATVHSEILDGLKQSDLPPAGTFDFAARLYQNALSGCISPVSPLASPNPATFTLPFTINSK